MCGCWMHWHICLLHGSKCRWIRGEAKTVKNWPSCLLNDLCVIYECGDVCMCGVCVVCSCSVQLTVTQAQGCIRQTVTVTLVRGQCAQVHRVVQSTRRQCLRRRRQWQRRRGLRDKIAVQHITAGDMTRPPCMPALLSPCSVRWSPLFWSVRSAYCNLLSNIAFVCCSTESSCRDRDITPNWTLNSWLSSRVVALYTLV